MATARTLEDKNIKNKLKEKALLQLGAVVASITLLQEADSNKDEDEEELLKAFQVLAAQIEQTRIKDKKWRNLTKILKRIKPWQLAVLKTMQIREWKLATVTDVTDKGMEVDA